MSLSNIDVFDALNSLRRNPASFLPDLEANLQYFKGNVLYKPNEIGLQTQEGPQAIYECIACLKNTAPLPAYIMDNGLNRAAARHANDIGPKGVTGHNGSDGSTMGQRIESEGRWNGHIGENINFGDNRTARDIICQLITDDGVPSRGHRNNCLSKDFKKVGIALAHHKTYKGCCVFDFAEEFDVNGSQPQQQHNHQPPPQYQNYGSQPYGQSQQQSYGQPQQQSYGGYQPQQQQQQSYQPPQQQQQPQMPPGCVNMKTNTQTTTQGNKKTVVVTHTYTMQDGSVRTETNTTTSTIG